MAEAQGLSENTPLIGKPEPGLQHLKTVDIYDETDRRLIRNISEKEWIERALKSEAAVRVDEVMEPLVKATEAKGIVGKFTGLKVFPETVETLKQEMFKSIYDTMGDEMMPEDLVRALVVKTDRYHPYMVKALTVLTLGVFFLFRPRDDEAVCVLTKNERISKYKVKRDSVFDNFRVVLKALLYMIGAFVASTVIPILIFQILGDDAISSEVDAFHSAYSYVTSKERFWRNVVFQAIISVAVLIWFVFWIWTKIPHDYGTRSRQTHTSDKVCATQLAIYGGKWGRSCRMRIFFGRFPDQYSLDSGMKMRIGGVVQTADKEQLSTKAMANPFMARSQRMNVVFLILFVQVFMLIDMYLTYVIPPIEWYSSGAEMSMFCAQPTLTESQCTTDKCKLWAIEEMEKTEESWYAFCENVYWVSNVTQEEETTEAGNDTDSTDNATGGKGDESSGKGDESSGKGDDSFGKGDDSSGKGDVEEPTATPPATTPPATTPPASGTTAPATPPATTPPATATTPPARAATPPGQCDVPALNVIKENGYPSAACSNKITTLDGDAAASAEACAAAAGRENVTVFSLFAHARSPSCYLYLDLKGPCENEMWDISPDDTTYMLVCEDGAKGASETSSKADEAGGKRRLFSKLRSMPAASSSSAKDPHMHCDSFSQKPPCCSGCVDGVLGSFYLNNGEVIFGMLVSLVCDAGAITLTVMAARVAFGHDDDKDHIDIKFKRRGKYSKQVAHFECTCPLAEDFLNETMENAFRDNNGEIPTGGKAKRTIDKTNEGKPKKEYLRRQHRYDDLSNDDTEGANFEDVSAWKFENEDDQSNFWADFFNKGRMMVESDKSHKSQWIPQVLIPKKILGICEEERVLGAWVEVPMLNLVNVFPIAVLSITAFVLMILTRDDSSHIWRWRRWEDEHTDKLVSAILNSAIAFLLGFLLLFLWLFLDTKHVVVLTDCRIFYVRYQNAAPFLMKFVPQLRLDVFRHDHEVTYGSMMTFPPTPYQRLTGAPWTPGAVFMQPGIFGLLRLDRARGNVLNIYQVVCQLTKPNANPFVSERNIQDAGVSVQICQQYVKDNMERTLNEVWRIKNEQPDDERNMIPDLYFTTPEEKPLFYWSFKEFGWLSSPHSRNVDIVVTTNRLYIYNRDIWKPFDAKTCCCFGMCWCTCLWRAFTGKKGLRRQSSFIDLSMLLSFCTEVEITPPVWYDPKRWPCVCPALDTCMDWCTLCLTCNNACRQVPCNSTTCSAIPRRSGARAQLWMMWRHRYNPTQGDLQCRIRPYNLKDPTLVQDALSFCCKRQRDVEEVELKSHSDPEGPDYEKVEMLRKIMGITQDMSGRE